MKKLLITLSFGFLTALALPALADEPMPIVTISNGTGYEFSCVPFPNAPILGTWLGNWHLINTGLNRYQGIKPDNQKSFQLSQSYSLLEHQSSGPFAMTRDSRSESRRNFEPACRQGVRWNSRKRLYPKVVRSCPLAALVLRGQAMVEL